MDSRERKKLCVFANYYIYSFSLLLSHSRSLLTTTEDSAAFGMIVEETVDDDEIGC